MKGVVFLGNRQCEVREVDEQEPGHGEARIRVMAAGICGSDLHLFRGQNGSDQVRGHEASGVVEEVGPGVLRLKPGDRVSVHHHFGCGVCPACAGGETVACSIHHRVLGGNAPGAFAESLVAPEMNCIPLPSQSSFEDGAFMACVGGTAFAALRRLRAVPHESLAVFGLGPVGLSCVLVGRSLGLRIIGIDVIDLRVELAKTCGAHEAVNSGEVDAVEAVRDFGRIKGYPDGADCVIETSGSAAGRGHMLPVLRREGRIAILGVGSDEKVINPGDIHGRAATLIGSVVFPLGWMWDLARFCAAGGLSFEPAVTHRLSIDDAQEALQIADEARGGKVVLMPNG